MRRLFFTAVLTLALAALAWPASLTVTSGQLAVTPNVAQADPLLKCDNGQPAPNNDLTKCQSTGGIKTDDCVQVGVVIGGKKCIPNNASNGGAIVEYLKLALQFLSGGVGLVILLMLIIAGIQYITSAGDPAQVKNAKERVVNALTALVLFILAFAIISFIVPGGIL
jgi:hypothetical protein